jgi:hypothetical protein
MTKIIYLGHEISADGVKPDKRLVEVVEKFPIPKINKHIKSFLGMAGYYRKFIENFAKIALLLTKQLKQYVPFQWTPEMTIAFNILKQKLITETNKKKFEIKLKITKDQLITQFIVISDSIKKKQNNLVNMITNPNK